MSLEKVVKQKGNKTEEVNTEGEMDKFFRQTFGFLMLQIDPNHKIRKGDLIPIVRVERLSQKQIQNALKGKNLERQADNVSREGTDSREQSGGEYHEEIGTAGTVNTGETSYQTPWRFEDPDLPDLNPDDNLNYYYIRNNNST